MGVITKHNTCNYFFHAWRWSKDHLYITKEFFKIISKGKTCNFKSKLYLNSDHNWCRIRKNNPRVSDHGKIYLCLNSHLSGWITHRIPILIRIQCSMAVNLLIMLYENYVYISKYACTDTMFISFKINHFFLI